MCYRGPLSFEFEYKNKKSNSLGNKVDSNITNLQSTNDDVIIETVQRKALWYIIFLKKENKKTFFE